MLQVRCSSVEIKPLFALPEHHPPPESQDPQVDSIPWAWLLEAAAPPHTALADAAVTSAATTAAAAAATAAATASARGGDAEKRGRGRQAMPDKEKATKAPPEPPPPTVTAPKKTPQQHPAAPSTRQSPRR